MKISRTTRLAAGPLLAAIAIASLASLALAQRQTDDSAARAGAQACEDASTPVHRLSAAEVRGAVLCLVNDERRRHARHAVALIEELSVDWDPERYKDRHRDRLLKIVRDKKKGKTIKAPSEPEVPTAVPDLMAALRESLEAARGEDGDGKKSDSSSSKKSGSKKAKAKA